MLCEVTTNPSAVTSRHRPLTRHNNMAIGGTERRQHDRRERKEGGAKKTEPTGEAFKWTRFWVDAMPPEGRQAEAPLARTNPAARPSPDDGVKCAFKPCGALWCGKFSWRVEAFGFDARSDVQPKRFFKTDAKSDDREARGK
ncbi:hypothetical protein EYF80_048895 [Liparis tanakae]|uniref:Uncharacterized protein n=1 Tax=Liparis tanakae TaxID=230148 RepID=A0A4Z2FI73_9TELE|nr:hypothetical protein EYF80_048895 [Liparis tanakae]